MLIGMSRCPQRLVESLDIPQQHSVAHDSPLRPAMALDTPLRPIMTFTDPRLHLASHNGTWRHAMGLCSTQQPMTTRSMTHHLAPAFSSPSSRCDMQHPTTTHNILSSLGAYQIEDQHCNITINAWNVEQLHRFYT